MKTNPDTRRFCATVLLSCAAFTAACASPEGRTNEEQRAYYGEFERATLAWLLEDYPDAEEMLDSAVGYTLVHQTVTKVPLVGAGGGYGMTYDRTNEERIYFRVRRLDLGAGWGIRNYRVVILFEDQEVLEGFKRSGFEFGAGAEATAKAGESGAAAAAATSGQGFEMYTLTDAGVSATLTIRVLRHRVIDLGAETAESEGASTEPGRPE